MVDAYQSLEQKPYESLYFFAETVIEHPLEKVWPHALDIGSWMSSHRLEALSGAPGKVGRFERVHPRGLSDEVPRPHHHLYGIAAVIPFKLIALEVLPEKGGSYGTRDWMSFDGILFIDIGGRTKIIFHMVDVHVRKGDEEALERRKREVEAGRELMDRHFENLRRVVEAG